MRGRGSANGSLRTHAVLTAAGIPCTVVLDSAVSYIMDRVDIVLVGTEAVVESGVSVFPLRPRSFPTLAASTQFTFSIGA